MRKIITASTLMVGLMALGLWLASPLQAADEPAGDQKMATLNGTITQIDVAARSLTVKGLLLSKTLQIAKDAAVLTSAEPQAKLADLKTGDRVTVSYTEQGDILIAHRIEVAQPEPPASDQPAQPAPPVAPVPPAY
jgi:Cu/Ag efflux protein CusF